MLDWRGKPEMIDPRGPDRLAGKLRAGFLGLTLGCRYAQRRYLQQCLSRLF